MVDVFSKALVAESVGASQPGRPQLSEHQQRTELSHDIALLHIMVTVLQEGSWITPMLVAHQLGNKIDSTHLRETTQQQSALERGLESLKAICRDETLSALDHSKLSEIIEKLEPVIQQTVTRDDAEAVDQSKSYKGLFDYLEQGESSAFFSSSRRSLLSRKNGQAELLIKELLQGNAPIYLWESLLAHPAFKKTMSLVTMKSDQVIMHPQLIPLLSLLKTNSRSLLRNYLPVVCKELIKHRDIDRLRQMVQLNIPASLLMKSDHRDINPIQYAAIYNVPEVVDLFLEAGVSKQQLMAYTQKGTYKSYSAVEWAISKDHPQFIDKLGQVGVPGSLLDANGMRQNPVRTVASMAARLNRVAALQALINAGLPVKQLLRRDRKGEAPHIIAAQAGHVDILLNIAAVASKKALFSIENITQQDLITAALCGGRHGSGNHSEVVAKLCDIDRHRQWMYKPFGESGLTPLIFSITRKKQAALNVLLERSTPKELLMTCRQGRHVGHYAVTELNYRRADVTNDLLTAISRKMPVDQLITLDHLGFSPIHLAVMGNKANAIRQLIELGLSPSTFSIAPRLSHETALHLAARRNSVDALNAMLEGGISMKQLKSSARGLQGGSALSIAKRLKHHAFAVQLSQLFEGASSKNKT